MDRCRTIDPSPSIRFREGSLSNRSPLPFVHSFEPRGRSGFDPLSSYGCVFRSERFHPGTSGFWEPWSMRRRMVGNIREKKGRVSSSSNGRSFSESCDPGMEEKEGLDRPQSHDLRCKRGSRGWERCRWLWHPHVGRNLGIQSFVVASLHSFPSGRSRTPSRRRCTVIPSRRETERGRGRQEKRVKGRPCKPGRRWMQASGIPVGSQQGREGTTFASTLDSTSSNQQVWIEGLSHPPRASVPNGVRNSQARNISFHQRVSMSTEIRHHASRRTRRRSKKDVCWSR